MFVRGRIFREGFAENIMASTIHLEDIYGITYVYMISIPCLCKYMATWVGKFTMGPWAGPRGPGPGPGAQGRLLGWGAGGGWGAAGPGPGARAPRP